MPIEIERKFLVENDTWMSHATLNFKVKQGYLSVARDCVTRVRILDDFQAFLTVKAKGHGISRPEFEYEIPLQDGLDMMALCDGRTIEKTRHIVPVDGKLQWEIDVFEGRYDGLIIAEIELNSEDEAFNIPDWLGPEVTDNYIYTNAYLATV